MTNLMPRSPEELADALATAGAGKERIRLGGSFSKDLMAGPLPPADVVISTSAMDRILQYEPSDLTISVEAGIRWADLTAALAANHQMIPLDPPFFDSATAGGVIAANSSGPRRRIYGTARDVVIGVKFATMEGKLVQSGGMVVKNVAGLDMAKLIIGSFGTLAAAAVVNFKLAPAPPAVRTFVLRFPSLDAAIEERNRILTGVLQPAAIDLVNPKAAARLGLEGFCLLIQAGGNAAVLDRYTRELAGADVLDEVAAASLWIAVREFTPAFLAEHPSGAVVRISATLDGVRDAIAGLPEPGLARAGNGVVYGYFSDAAKASLNGHRGVIEFAPEAAKASLVLWPEIGSEFATMEKLKNLFDPGHLLNRGRLYGRI
jgi:glycolate oxidase FAD binding subunit